VKISPHVSFEPTPEQHKKLQEVSQQFEALLVNRMIGAMRKTVTKGGLIPESQAERIYQSFLDYEHSLRLAESGQMGLSKIVYQQLLRSMSVR